MAHSSRRCTRECYYERSRGAMDQLQASACRHVPRSAHGQQVDTQAHVTRRRANEIAQMLSLRAFTGYAFTTFRAGLAFTITTLPKTSRLPAFVAGFVRVLILHSPGTVKIPVLDTSVEAIS